MERAEAETIYDAGREACVSVLLRLSAQLERLERRVEKLEERSRESSRNSSRPPSQDPPQVREQRRSEPGGSGTGRRAGGQAGHRGSGRGLLPEDQVDEIVDHYPESCRRCGRRFGEDERTAAERPGRYQVAELPPITVVVSEHRAHRLRCPRCRAKTVAALPEGVGGSAFGPRLKAAIVTMTARNRISRRDMAELARELFGLGLSTGAVDAICQRASLALASPHERLAASVLGSPAVNVDETGWRCSGERRTLWAAITPRAAVFRIAEDRHRDRLSELLGEDYAGIVCSDRWWAYDHLDPSCRQACWAHLARDFRRHAEGLAEQKTFGERGLELCERLFSAWQAYRGHGDRRRLARETAPIQDELYRLLGHAARKSKRTRHHRVFANNLLKIWPALWTFVTVEGIEPTNNAAERGLRGAVIYRKLSHGSRSDDGERFIERALSASLTCRLQGRSLFAYLADLLTAHARGDPLPGLT